MKNGEEKNNKNNFYAKIQGISVRMNFSNETISGTKSRGRGFLTLHTMNVVFGSLIAFLGFS